MVILVDVFLALASSAGDRFVVEEMGDQRFCL
jgi:hypothetical protein